MSWTADIECNVMDGWCYDLGLEHHINQGAQRYFSLYILLSGGSHQAFDFVCISGKKIPKEKPINFVEMDGWCYDLGLEHLISKGAQRLFHCFSGSLMVPISHSILYAF